MSAWRGVLRVLARRHRLLHMREQWLLGELQDVRVSMCRVSERMDHTRAVMAQEVAR